LEVAVGALLSFAAVDTLSKRVSSRLGNKMTALTMFAASLLPLLFGMAFLGLTKVDWQVVALSVGSGAVFASAYLLVYRSLETKQVSNTASLTPIEYVIMSALSVLVLGESVTGVEIACFAAIFIGAFLATTTRGFKFDMGYVPALVAMVAFGASMIPLAIAQQASGGLIAPLLISRCAGLLVVGAYILVSPENRKEFNRAVPRGARLVLLAENAAMGVFAALGSVCLLVLAQVNFLAVGSAMVSVEPAIVIFFGYLLYHDRFERHQLLGFAALIAGAVVLGAVA